MRGLWLLAWITCWVLGPHRAVAQAMPEPPRSELASRDLEARSIYEAGQTAFRDGRYEAALERFEESYALSARPALLYNMGLVCERLARAAAAADYYERYLLEEPLAENRTDVEARIAALRERAPMEVAQPTDHTPMIALITAGGLSFLAGGALTAFGAIDFASVEGAPDDAFWPDYAAANDRAPALLGVGVGLGALGLVLLGVGIGLYTATPNVPAYVRLGPASLSVEGHF